MGSTVHLESLVFDKIRIMAALWQGYIQMILSDLVLLISYIPDHQAFMKLNMLLLTCNY